MDAIPNYFVTLSIFLGLVISPTPKNSNLSIYSHGLALALNCFRSSQYVPQFNLSIASLHLWPRKTSHLYTTQPRKLFNNKAGCQKYEFQKFQDYM